MLQVEAGVADKPMIHVEFKHESKVFSAEEVSSMILTKMKATAEAYLGHQVNSAAGTSARQLSGSTYISTFRGIRWVDSVTETAQVEHNSEGV